MKPHLCVGIAHPDGSILEEFDISHNDVGFQEFFRYVEEHRQRLALPVAVAMEGYNGYARPLDRLVQEKGYRLYNVNNMKLAQFKKIFPKPAKTDAIDTRKILELFILKEHLPMAKDALQEVVATPAVNEKLKRLSRRRRRLVNERVRVLNNMQADLQAVCPELLAITRRAGNLWFLRFLTFRDDLRQLARLRRSTILQIPSVGQKYVRIIQGWQRGAKFSAEIEYVGPMIIEDARRILELCRQIHTLDEAMADLADHSEIAKRLVTIHGFGKTSIAELAGEIGTQKRFTAEASLALYVGMSPLTHQVRSDVEHKEPSPGQSSRQGGDDDRGGKTHEVCSSVQSVLRPEARPRQDPQPSDPRLGTPHGSCHLGDAARRARLRDPGGYPPDALKIQEGCSGLHSRIDCSSATRFAMTLIVEKWSPTNSPTSCSVY